MTDAPHLADEAFLIVQARYHGRARAVFLSHSITLLDGEEDWDAWHTLADAKRHLLGLVGRKSARWEYNDAAKTWSATVALRDG